MATDRGEYRPMFCRILNGPDFRRLSPIARACLWPIKLRLPGAGIGVIPALIATLAEDTGFSEDEVRTAIVELEASPFEDPAEGPAGADEGHTAWLRRQGPVVWLVRGLEFEPTSNPRDRNHRMHIRRTVASLPSVGLVDEFKSRYAMWFVDGSDDGPVTPITPHAAPARGVNGVRPGSSKGPRSQSPSLSPSQSPGRSKQLRPPSPVFEQAWATYPKRPGNSRGDALKAWNARVADGADEAQMLAGTKAYAEYVAALHTQPEYIKLGATFFGPGKHYELDWTPSENGRRGSGPESAPEEPEPTWIEATTNPEEIARLKANGFR